MTTKNNITVKQIEELAAKKTFSFNDTFNSYLYDEVMIQLELIDEEDQKALQEFITDWELELDTTETYILMMDGEGNGYGNNKYLPVKWDETELQIKQIYAETFSTEEENTDLLDETYVKYYYKNGNGTITSEYGPDIDFVIFEQQ